ncbi:hypothetical protein D038_0700A, partial [Vibrio parahaemolyticus IDH02189]
MFATVPSSVPSVVPS